MRPAYATYICATALLSGCVRPHEMPISGPAINRQTSTDQCTITEPFAAPVFNEALSKTLRARLIEMVDKGIAPSVDMMVEQKGKVVFRFTYGMADIEDGRVLDQSALYRLYSMTKPVTSVAALQLIARGQLSLDDPISKFVPEFVNSRVLGVNGSTFHLDRPLLVRDLITHQSGLTYRDNVKNPLGAIYARRGIPAGPGFDKPPTDGSDPVASNEQLASRIAGIPMLHQPAARFTYGNSTDILGRVIEVVTGDPLSVALQRQIFGPLEMTSTSFQVLSKDVGRLTSAYVGRSQIEDSDGGVLSAPPTNLLRLGKLVKFDDDQTSFMLRNPLVEFGGAGLVSSTHDYLRFSQALREAVTGSGMGTLLLPPDIAQAMASNQLSVEAQRNSEMLGKELGFGFGVAIKLTPTKSAPVFPQCGFFWGGAASTNFWVDPASETSGVMMAQVVGGDVRSYWLAVLAEIHSDD